MPHRTVFIAALIKFLNTCPMVLAIQPRRRTEDDGLIPKLLVASIWPLVSAAGAVLGMWLVLHDSQLLMKQELDTMIKQHNDMYSRFDKQDTRIDANRIEAQSALTRHIELTTGK